MKSWICPMFGLYDATFNSLEFASNSQLQGIYQIIIFWETIRNNFLVRVKIISDKKITKIYSTIPALKQKIAQSSCKKTFRVTIAFHKSIIIITSTLIISITYISQHFNNFLSVSPTQINSSKIIYGKMLPISRTS